MKNLNVVIGVLVGAVIGFAVRSQMANSMGAAIPSAKVAAAPTNNAPPGAEPIYRVPIGLSPAQGPDDAKVTIVEFSDFECPYCGRAIETVKQVEKNFGRDVRVVFKNNPLPMHPNAPFAAKAALAAGKQGKFWDMHDKLFEANNSRQQGALAKDKVLAMAQSLGLDMAKFDTDVASQEMNDLIGSDQAQARQIGANGTPNFFVNGVKVAGAMPYESFKPIVEAALKRAEAQLAKGTPREKLYEALIKDGVNAPPAPPPSQPQPPPPAQARKIEIDESAPSSGGKHAKVVIVEWSDFQCPFCSRVEPTLKQIESTYKDDVRIIWRNQPLSFHPNAMPAAKAAMAAHKQGKFWQMHDLMFSNQTQLSDAKYEEWAKQLGLDVARWKKDKDAPEVEAAIKKDMGVGSSVGADGTPTFFINGKLISGAMPFENFKSIIDEQISKANAELKKGTRPEKLYEALIAENVKSAGAPAAPGAAEGPVKIEVGSSPFIGPKNAPVTIVVWSDFQCPFCGRAEPTIAELRKEYGNKLKVVWKNQPLSFHPNAMPAAEAAMAANEQGKFWEMHDKLFENNTALSPDLYEKLAKDLGLDMKKFKASIDGHKNEAAIKADMAAGAAVGASGTPTFFINGRKLVGAQPGDAFKTIIDAELGSAVAKK